MMREFRPHLIPPLPPGAPSWPFVNGPIDLEIGAGAGWHAIQYAKANPSRFLIAIERTTKADRMATRTRSHSFLKNLLAVRADAIHWCAQMAPPKCFSRIFIYYPNPYPKASQKNLRWPNMPFMGFLKSRLADSGELILSTNIESYALDSAESLSQTWKFRRVQLSLLPRDFQPRTHFEKKYLRRGEPCFEIRAQN